MPEIYTRLAATAKRMLDKYGVPVVLQSAVLTTDSVGGQSKAWADYLTVNAVFEATLGGKTLEQFRVVPRARYRMFVRWYEDTNLTEVAKAGRLRVKYQGQTFNVASVIMHGDKVLLEFALTTGGPSN